MKGSAPSVRGKRKNPLRGIRDALRGPRTMRPRFQRVETMEPASCESPLPKEREERLPLLWIPPPPPRVQPHVYLCNLVQWGLNCLITGLQGPHQDSQLENQAIRSTPRIQRNVSGLYSMKVQRICVRSKSNTLAQHLHLDEVKRADTCIPHFRR